MISTIGEALIGTINVRLLPTLAERTRPGECIVCEVWRALVSHFCARPVVNEPHAFQCPLLL